MCPASISTLYRGVGGALPRLVHAGYVYMSRTQKEEMLFDVVVVGAGIAGSSTAYHLTNMLENDEKILLLEQVCRHLGVGLSYVGYHKLWSISTLLIFQKCAIFAPLQQGYFYLWGTIP